MSEPERQKRVVIIVVAMLDWGYDYLRFDPPVRLITGSTAKDTLTAKE